MQELDEKEKKQNVAKTKILKSEVNGGRRKEERKKEEKRARMEVKARMRARH